MAELSFSERRDWIRLIRTQTIGPVAFRDLIVRYGNAATALDALPSLIRKKSVSIPTLEQVEREMEYAEQMGVRLICAVEPDYPKYLKALDPPPPIISVLGDISHLHRPCIAIVGSRNASALGQKFAGQIAGELSEAGHVIVSGLARGIDRAAHYGALERGTAAVLGGGIDHIYPRENTELYEEIRAKGVIVSESPLGYRASAKDFPRRNRIISGRHALLPLLRRQKDQAHSFQPATPWNKTAKSWQRPAPRLIPEPKAVTASSDKARI